ncbi:MAG: hypothetical protein PHX50_11665, partial [Massilibacteroides sp.]|nr:hypothetical protein [Massilibacteroides sp.]MDD3063464.1 hypothetical protein [Massilibacteroides sp.]MDD4661124.1 hypothetical protein [Massilibacteroides sp.]
MKRRSFFKLMTAGGLTTAFSPVIKAAPVLDSVPAEKKPETNIADAVAVPRNKYSMPGLFPGCVVRVNHPEAVVDGKPSDEVAYEMLKTSMLALTGLPELKEAWLQFVGPEDIIGIKVNPVAGKLLTTSHAVTGAIVRQLEEAGIPRKNLVIWDRREMQLHETGYTEENYPGIRITGTECQDADGGYYAANGKLYSEDRIDKSHYFYANVEGEYDAYTIPFMVNGGLYSYFTRI